MASLPVRRTGMIESNLALFPGWQVGAQTQQKRIARRDLLGALARAERAPLGELELDALTWLTQEWFEQGSPTSGVIQFTWYRLGQDLYGHDGGRQRTLMQEAIDNLAAALITLRCIDVLSGGRTTTLRSKVHIVEAVVDHEDVLLIRDGDLEPARVGGLRDDTVKVKLAEWLVAQLMDGLIVLDWQTQRQLGGSAKRLWYYLAARAADFVPSGIDNDERLVVDVDVDFYASLNLQAARERDNRSALARAGARIVVADRTYRSVEVAQSATGYELRVMRAIDDAPRSRPLAEIDLDVSA
jgi:hypothetical protein